MILTNMDMIDSLEQIAVYLEEHPEDMEDIFTTFESVMDEDTYDEFKDVCGIYAI